ncbi:MAG: hypothetical protein R3F11_01180 [Verrucomicrobiales bacterium]
MIFATFLTLFGVSISQALASVRAEQLRRAVEGANRVTVKDVEIPLRETSKDFEFSGAAEIAALVASLDFERTDSGSYCMCPGDVVIAFFVGEKELARLTYHHGKSLRWEGWDGDSPFTAASVKAWRQWFKEHEEPRFEEMHQRTMETARKEKAIDDRFKGAFPPEARTLFEVGKQTGWVTVEPMVPVQEGDEQSPQVPDHAKKLVSLFGDRGDFGIAAARALGGLSTDPDGFAGIWGSRTPRETLVLQGAAMLEADDFRKVLETEDAIVLLGVARLFFFEGMGNLLPEKERALFAAKLTRVVATSDRCGNVDTAIQEMVRYPCPAATRLLEEIASGAIKIEISHPEYKSEPGPRVAACLVLAKSGSEKAADFAKRAAEDPNLDEMDRAALRVVRAHGGERGLLDKSVFEINSHAVGLGAISALESEGGKAALDAIIMGGSLHLWAAVREEAVLAAERMIGKKWFWSEGGERADRSTEDIRAWWQNNRESYQPQPK